MKLIDGVPWLYEYGQEDQLPPLSQIGADSVMKDELCPHCPEPDPKATFGGAEHGDKLELICGLCGHRWYRTPNVVCPQHGLPYEGVGDPMVIGSGIGHVLTFTCPKGHVFYGPEWTMKSTVLWSKGELGTLAVRDLRDMASDYGLEVTGNKKALIDRLFEFGMTPLTKALLLSRKMPHLADIARDFGVSPKGPKADLVARILWTQAETWTNRRTPNGSS